MSCNNIHSLATGKESAELLYGCISCDEKKKLKKKEIINYTLLFWGQNIFQRARICDRGKIGLIALHLNFINLGFFMLNTVH